MELEELKAYLDLALLQRLLDKEPSPPKKKLKLHLSSTAPVMSEKLRFVRHLSTRQFYIEQRLGRQNVHRLEQKERNKLLPEDSVLGDLTTIVNCALFSSHTGKIESTVAGRYGI